MMILDLSDTQRVVCSALDALILISGEIEPDPEVHVSIRFGTVDGVIFLQIHPTDSTPREAQALAERLGFGGQDAHTWHPDADGSHIHHLWHGHVMEHPVQVVTVVPV